MSHDVLPTAGGSQRSHVEREGAFAPWAWIAIIGLAAVVFARTVGIGLYSDDYLLARPWTLSEVFGAFTGPFDPTGYNDPYFRPLASVIFALEWHIWGTNRWGYHLVNIALHAGAAIAVWAVLRRIRVVWWAAFAGAAFFVIVPSNVATVVYVAHRTDAIVAICVCLALLCVERYAVSSRATWLVWLNVLYIVALLTKEVAIAVVPFVATFWIYLHFASRSPLASTASGEQPSIGRYWANEMRLIGRSIADRTLWRRGLALLGPLVMVTVAYLAYRAAVMPPGSFIDRFGEAQNPVSAMAGGLNSTVKGVPWEVRALPLLPIVAAFVVGLVLRPRSLGWRYVLLGIGGMVSGVLPLTFGGTVEPRLLYVAEIGMAIAIAGLATVFGEAVSAARAKGRRVPIVGGAIVVVSLAVIAAVGIAHVDAQDVYAPEGEQQLTRDLRLWIHPEHTAFIPAANLREIERHLFEAGLIDEFGQPTS